MTVGSKVVCVDDKFPEQIIHFYQELPIEGEVYTVRNVSVGLNWHGEAGEVCLLLQEITNPKSDAPPFPERGFNSERFMPLQEHSEKSESQNVVFNTN